MLPGLPRADMNEAFGDSKMTKSDKKEKDRPIMQKPDVHDARDYINAVGNTGYLWEFIAYFEKKLAEEIAPYQEKYEGVMGNIYDRYAYSKCPNFAVWIRLYAELICNKALSELCRAKDLQTKIKNSRFKTTIKDIIKIVEAERQRSAKDIRGFDDMIRAIKLTIELRHSLQHGGIPNIIRDMQFPEIDINDVANMIAPQNYKETKEIFNQANNLIEFLPRPILICYQDGHVEIRMQNLYKSKDAP